LDYFNHLKLDCIKQLETEVNDLKLLQEELKGKKVAVVGFGGRSGIALVHFLAKTGCHILVSDQKLPTELNDQLSQVKEYDLELNLGGHDVNRIVESDLILQSPGVPLDIPLFQAARKERIPVVGELEFASWFLDAPIIAVTGTNGKTTTTTLIGELFKDWGENPFVGGNIGSPLINAVLSKKNYSHLIVEVSTFQLETIQHFSPSVALLLNISEDHLDRHRTLEHYAELKGKLFSTQTQTDHSIINCEDPLAFEISKSSPAQKIYFSLQAHEQSSLWLEGKRVVGPLLKEPIDLTSFPLLGEHNLENALACTAAAAIFSIPESTIENRLRSVKALPHRMERVSSKDGITYINDSKSTTVASTIRALRSVDGPLILILGGKDKGISYQLLGEQLPHNLKKIFAYGQVAPRILKELSSKITVEIVDRFDLAVQKARMSATSGDTLLLSPAAASQDQFKDYEQRGESFCKLIKEPIGGAYAQEAF
jgi:UDP-N-acetylmuramoylalanine--D-glutamate ligase